MDLHSQIDLLVRILLAILLGGIIGFEREMAKKPAGIRTTMLVAGAAALLVSLGDVIVERFAAEGLKDVLRTDPIRIVEAIIVGISFIGAGTIIQRESEERVENLTTAATILFTATIGIAVALEQFFLASGLTIALLIINFVFGRAVAVVKKKMKRHDSEKENRPHN